MGVMGESAGGNLAAVLCLLARDRGGPTIDHQTLIYPATDLVGQTESHRKFENGIILTGAAMKTFRNAYAGTHDPATEWRLSPSRAPDLGALPPALVIVAAHDPLHDDGVQYAASLRAAGNAVCLAEYGAMPHGFANFPHFSRDATVAMRLVIEEQRKFLAATGTSLGAS